MNFNLLFYGVFSSQIVTLIQATVMKHLCYMACVWCKEPFSLYLHYFTAVSFLFLHILLVTLDHCNEGMNLINIRVSIVALPPMVETPLQQAARLKWHNFASDTIITALSYMYHAIITYCLASMACFIDHQYGSPLFMFLRNGWKYVYTHGKTCLSSVFLPLLLYNVTHSQHPVSSVQCIAKTIMRSTHQGNGSNDVLLHICFFFLF